MNRKRKKRFGNLKHSAKVKKDNIILVHCELLILLHICSSVKHASYVQHRFKITLYFQVFSRKKVKFKFKKILVTCWANGSWQILFSSVAVHTQIVESEKKCLECAIFITHESATSIFESWKKTNKYLLIDSLNMIITCRVICKKWVAKLQETNVFTPGSKNFKSSAIAEKCTKQTYSLLTARKKISLDKNSLEIQAKRCYFIFNP